VNPADDQRLRQWLHEEFGALEISPPPVLRVTSRGQGIRTRRRALAIGGLVVVLAGGALFARATGGQHAVRRAVTVSAPNPAAPGGVFASGAADGKRWKLAVGNIAADPGTRWCLPAVMFNGRYGNVLFKADPNPSYGNPAFLTHIPGFPGVSAVFTQVAPDVTHLVATFPGGRRVSVRPVWVSACTQRFHIAGFAYAGAKRSPSELATYSALGLGDGLRITLTDVNPADASSPGIWVNLDTSRVDIAISEDANPIGAGRINGQTWHIGTSLGLFGQCYTPTLRGGIRGGPPGKSQECVPVTAPPRVTALDPVPVLGATTALPGYAGLVNPRAAKVAVGINNGVTLMIRPTNVAGRAYIAFVVPKGCRPNLLTLFDAAGHMFASTTRLPPPAG
jgi:hypothetical protein